ncbi:hypothetical protein [Proteiniborus sp. MB09-C3]|uniref:hypothetical protein n=1 Tax=Proteiniborus sp. MB09-C3 TaxID=3050072 RepID=UPI0025566C16|nr:hypothetical protein [Proteiniborus sp. MB09-C3]WIV12557.1 hypothetical protein QO263_02225 [Proteiniborus sp. MB09-C3]
MANPLARVIMNNITQNSKIADTRSNYSKNTYSISTLGQKEEQLLLSVMKKSSDRAAGTSKTLETLSLSSKSADYNNRGDSFEKVKLGDLVKGKVKSGSSKATDIKSNTMMTLNDLAGRIKKPNDNQANNVGNSAKQNNTKDVYIKTGVINNLEAYIPKVSLDSIGKKGSLL